MQKKFKKNPFIIKFPSKLERQGKNYHLIMDIWRGRKKPTANFILNVKILNNTH